MSLRFVKPASPSLVTIPPAGTGWIHEVKYDGYRTQIVIEAGAVRIYSRNGLDWTRRYPFTAAAVAQLKCRDAIIDGEMCVLDRTGASDFKGLLRTINRWPELLTLVAFDLIHLDGKDLRDLPIEERRAKLRRLLGEEPPAGLMLSDNYDGEGLTLFGAVEQRGLEGIVSKRKGSRYRSGDTRDWLKTKCFVTETFDVIGVDKTPGGAPTAILGRDGAVVGDAFISLSSELKDLFWQYTQAFQIGSPAGVRRKGATWLRPGLRAKVRYLRGEGAVRHATLQSLELEPAE